jgi:hypothetical protein
LNEVSEVGRERQIFFVLCQCGLRMRGTLDELIPIVQKHGREAHNMEASREDITALARPEPQ